MKLPANPTKPYMRHRPQTLGEASIASQGTSPAAFAVGDRLEEISFRSAAFTPAISSGRLRNHTQNRAAHARPRQATSAIETGQPGFSLEPKATVMSQTAKREATAPPSRLQVQIDP